MNRPRYRDLTAEEQEWVEAYLNETIEPEAFASLQDRMRERPELRAAMRKYLALDEAIRDQVAEGEPIGSQAAAAPWMETVETTASVPTEPERRIIPFVRFVPLAAAAGIAFFLGLGLMHWANRTNSDDAGEGVVERSSSEEPSARGFAVISGLFDAVWPQGEADHREGDTLGAEVFRLASGTAEIQFFSGATMTIEGPAEISLKSAWEASCLDGAVRMQVPPAARGFKLHAPSTEIIDLGTEFGLVVRDGKGHVEVLDGEIAVRHRDEEETILTKGKAVGLVADGPSTEVQSGEVEFPDTSRFGSQAEVAMKKDYERWQQHRDALSEDERLIAYYTFDEAGSGPGRLASLGLPRDSSRDGAVILAEAVDGRWAGLKSAFEFRRPGSRVRVNLPGEFPAFTFVCWVRIDSLDRWYNALFMGDGYETGEPHWQIRDDGVMMLSVMVDDSRPNPNSPNDAGFHRVYYSPPMWDPSMSGQWFHLASVFDPANRRVSHYVNGVRIHRQKIEDTHFIDTLRIGNGEIGNWGQPFREDPTWAIRNLNGRLDELAIFRSALQDDEIAGLYERSRRND